MEFLHICLFFYRLESWSGRMSSIFLTVSKAYPARPGIVPSIPMKTKTRAIPVPGPVPTSHPNRGARHPPGIIAGSKIQSARGPVIAIAMGWAILAKSALVAKTLPCI